MKINKLFIFIICTLLLSGCQEIIQELLETPQKSTIAYAGKPLSVGYSNDLSILNNEGFIVAYDEKRLNPAWVAYKIFKVSPDAVSPKRPSHFTPDNRLRVQVEHTDYTHSGYDRGHLAPNYAIATRYGEDAQAQTFLTSNISPQKHAFNAGIWEKLEKKIAKEYAQDFSEIWVLTGPVYDLKNKPRYLKNTQIQIPMAFFMIVVDELNGQPRTLAFIIPQNASTKEKSLNKFLTSIDSIEEKTGFNFLSELDDSLENPLEAKKYKQIW